MDSSLALKLFSSNTVYLLLTCVIVTVIVFLSEINNKLGKKMKFIDLFYLTLPTTATSVIQNCNSLKNRAPGPKALPIIGNLQSLDGYEIPYQAFGALAKKYGPIISLQLGSVPTIVVNGIDNIKEVLIQKATHFDSRPNFRRYHQLFSGNKENSLAFCDWSSIQKLRRDMLTPHTFPRNFTPRFHLIDNIINKQIEIMIENINSNENTNIFIKEYLLKTSANVFTEYFCSKTFDWNDGKFNTMLKNFDGIFYEVNQGYAADFLPFLLKFHKKNLKQMETWSREIRYFILENIIGDRKNNWSNNQINTNKSNDYIDSLMEHVEEKYQPALEWDTALFTLEDIIGGHSAIGNFLVKVFGYLSKYPHVQKNIQVEINNILQQNDRSFITLSDRNSMPYTEASIMECLRLISSPIVPHVSNQHSTIGGYDVPKDTLIFLNNYDLNMSSVYWEKPQEFMPERFLKNNQINKPDYFLPYGAGRRSCMGYKLVQFISFSIVANLLNNYDIKSMNVECKVQPGSLAVLGNGYELDFIKRK